MITKSEVESLKNSIEHLKDYEIEDNEYLNEMNLLGVKVNRVMTSVLIEVMEQQGFSFQGVIKSNQHKGLDAIFTKKKDWDA